MYVDAARNRDDHAPFARRALRASSGASDCSSGPAAAMVNPADGAATIDIDELSARELHDDSAPRGVDAAPNRADYTEPAGCFGARVKPRARAHFPDPSCMLPPPSRNALCPCGSGKRSQGVPRATAVAVANRQRTDDDFAARHSPR